VARCAVCGKPATKYDGWMVGNNGVKQYSGPDTFGWCDEHYEDRHKYKMIFESQIALDLWKSRVPHLYEQLKEEEILLVYKPQLLKIEEVPHELLKKYKLLEQTDTLEESEETIEDETDM